VVERIEYIHRLTMPFTNTESSQVSITSSTDSYKQVKARIKDTALSSAVAWAKAEKMLDGQEKVIRFEKEYMEKVINVAFTGINEGGLVEEAILTKFGEQDVLRGKIVEVDGKPYQPTVKFASRDCYTDPEGNVITDSTAIGKYRLCKLVQTFESNIGELHTLKQQRKLLRWKQKYHRYCYNFNDTEMTKYHNKISECESAMLDARTEANAEGRHIDVIHHHGCEGDEDGSMDSGERTRQRGEDTKSTDNGQSMRLFADKMKEAYDVRVSTIQTVKIMLTIPVEQRKHIKLPTTYTEIRNTDASAPVLI